MVEIPKRGGGGGGGSAIWGKFPNNPVFFFLMPSLRQIYAPKMGGLARGITYYSSWMSINIYL